MTIIGLCGLPKSGKGEVCQILSQRFGFHAVDIKHPLREAASILTGVPYGDFLSQTGKETLHEGVPLRKVMGELGKAVEGIYGNDYLINRALTQNWTYPGKRLVVDALRMDQPDKFEHFVVEVVSERGIVTGNDFDCYTRNNIAYTIRNDGSLGQLEFAVAEMLTKLGVETNE